MTQMMGIWWVITLFGEHNTKLKKVAQLRLHCRWNILMIWHKDRVLAKFIKNSRLPVQGSIYIVSLGWIKILTWGPSKWILSWQAGKKMWFRWCFCKLQFKRKNETQRLLYCYFFKKRFAFSSYSETIYSMSVSTSSQTEHHDIIFASGRTGKE